MHSEYPTRIAKVQFTAFAVLCTEYFCDVENEEQIKIKLNRITESSVLHEITWLDYDHPKSTQTTKYQEVFTPKKHTDHEPNKDL